MVLLVLLQNSLEISLTHYDGCILMTLTTKDKQKLKAKAHSLKPIVFIGSQGLTTSVKKEADRALKDHELIKLRIRVEGRELRRSLFTDICDSLQAELIQVIGSIGIIYRKNDEQND